MEHKKEFEDSAAMKQEWQQRHEATGDSDVNADKPGKEAQDDWHDHADTSKYLDLEQRGVSFTHESHPTMNSDYLETDNEDHEKWRLNGENSRNADAFSQDDYILRDNIDLDEDQNTSISAEDNDK